MQTLPAYIQMVYKEYEYFANQEFTVKEIIEKAKQYGKNNHLSLSFTDDKLCKDFKVEFQEYFKKKTSGVCYKFSGKEKLFEELSKKKPKLMIEK